MKLFVVTGMPAAGKNIAAQYASENQYPYFSTGDFVRAEIKKRGCSGDPESSARISTELRGDDGLGVTRLAVDEVMKQNKDIVFLEGVRSWAEIKFIKSKTPCVLVAFLAPREMRLNRIRQRGREDDSAEFFEKRDEREMEYGVGVCIALADAYILNIGTIDGAMRQIDNIVKSM